MALWRCTKHVKVTSVDMVQCFDYRKKILTTSSDPTFQARPLRTTMCRADSLNRDNRSTEATNIDREPDISLDSACSAGLHKSVCTLSAKESHSLSQSSSLGALMQLTR
jgi:hypothetical protein